MIKRFLADTLDLVLTVLCKLRLLHGNPAWHRERMRRRLGLMEVEAETFKRSVKADHRMCRECRTLVPKRERACPACGAPMAGIPTGGAGRVLRAVVPGSSTVSTSLLGLIAAIYLAGAMAFPAEGSILAPSNIVLIKLGAMVPELLLLEGEWWRVFNPMFLHGGLLHVGFNCYVLSSIGPLLEAILGRRRFLVLFLGTGVFSFMVSAAAAVFISPRWSVGASGAVFGLIGYGIGAGFRARRGVLRGLAPRFVGWALINFMIGLSVGFIDNSAHFGGLIAGLAFGWIVGDGVLADPRARRAWLLVATVLSLLTAAGFVLTLIKYANQPLV